MKRRAPGSCRSVRALTLIEMLAVIVIMSLVASVATVGLNAADESSRMAQAGARMLEMDVRARLHARGLGESIQMAMNAESRSWQLRRSNGEMLNEVSSPRGVWLEIEIGHSPAIAIAFNRHGLSVDYSLIMRTAARVERWNVAGVTGWVERETTP